MGAISALIVGPCVAAPLAGVLVYISQSGNAWVGGSALFAMAWGMGLPLLLVGASSSAWLPRSGPWMAGVSRFFGMLLHSRVNGYKYFEAIFIYAIIAPICLFASFIFKYFFNFFF